MRRSDREVTDRNEILAIMDKCDVCRIALNNDGYPYIIPLNFGIKDADGVIGLYFHCADEGTKLDLIRADSRTSFEMDCGHKLVGNREKGYCTMEYESVIGKGRIEILSDDEKYEALCILMSHYYKNEEFPFSKAAMPRTVVFKLTVEEMTAKRRRVG